jgi:hypothetical protein
MAQFARPISDVTINTWWTSPLYSKVNDSSDSTYINGPLGSTLACELQLGSVTDPASNTNHVLTVRAIVQDGSAAGEKLTFYLYEGATLRATSAAETISRTTATDYTYTLTSTEADSITNYSDLRVRMAQTTIGGIETIRVYEVYLSVPDAPVTTYRSYSQSQAQIKGIVPSYAQAQTQIKVTARAYALAMALIFTTPQYSEVFDTFTRTVSPGLGTSDNAGDWKVSSSAAGWSVTSGEARVDLINQDEMFIHLTNMVAPAKWRVSFEYGLLTELSDVGINIFVYDGGRSTLDTTVYGAKTAGIIIQSNKTIQFAAGYGSAANTWSSGATYGNLGDVWVYDAYVFWNTSTGKVQADSRTWNKAAPETVYSYSAIHTPIPTTDSPPGHTILRVLGAGISTNTVVKIDNFKVTRWTAEPVAQAQATIFAPMQSYAQASSSVKASSFVHSMVQGLVKQTYFQVAQAQARIKIIIQSYAQSQGTIKAAMQAYAQANALILNGIQSPAQAQTYIIISNTNNYAQANALIDSNIKQQFAQAAAWIVPTRAHALAMAQILPVYGTLLDTFTRTVSSGSGWGTAENGDTWLSLNGNTGVGVNGNQSYVGPSTSNSKVFMTKQTGPSVYYPDWEVSLKFSLDVLPSSTISVGVFLNKNTAQETGSSNYIHPAIDVSSTGTITLRVWKYGSTTPNTNYGTYVAGDTWILKARKTGLSIRIKAWKDGDAEPDWAASGATLSESQASIFNWVGCYINSSTTTSITASIDDFTFYPVGNQVAQTTALIESKIKLTYAQAEAYLKAPMERSALVAACIAGERFHLTDYFNRTVTDGWGANDSGDVYTLEAGTLSNFDVNGTSGTINLITSGEQLIIVPKTSVHEHGYEVRGIISLDKIPATDSIIVHVMGGYSTKDPSITTKSFGAQITFSTSSTFTMVASRIGSGNSSGTNSIPYAAGESWNFRIQAITRPPTSPTSMYTLNRRKLWKVGTEEPLWSTAATTETTVSTPYTVTPGPVLIRAYASSSVSNLPILVTLDDLEFKNGIAIDWLRHAQARAKIVYKGASSAQAQTSIKQTYPSFNPWGNPSTIAQDSFTEEGTGLVDLSTHTAEIGGTWTATSDWRLDRDLDRIDSIETFGTYYATLADVNTIGNGYIQAHLSGTTPYIGLRLNIVPSPNYDYSVRLSGSTVSLYRHGSVLASTVAGSGSYICFEVIGQSPTRLRVFRSDTSDFSGKVPIIETTDNTATHQRVSGYWGLTAITSPAYHDDLLAVQYAGEVVGSPFAQAQAEIVSSVANYKVSAQAQAQIKGTVYNHAQAQTQIKTTYQVWAQSNARIKQTYQVYSQANAAITKTSQAYAQAQTRVKATYPAFAQSAATIKATSRAYAQASVWIKQTYPFGGSTVVAQESYAGSPATNIDGSSLDIGGTWDVTTLIGTGGYTFTYVGDGTGRHGVQLPSGSRLLSAQASGVSFGDGDVYLTSDKDSYDEEDGSVVYGSVYSGILLRKGSGADAYRVTVSDNAVILYRITAGVASIVASVTYTAYTASYNARYRVNVSGYSPTTFKIRAWTLDQPEPSTWDIETTDNTSANQIQSGGVGTATYSIRSSISSSAAIFDDFLATTGSVVGPTFAQAQAAIKAITLNYSQAQAHIRITSNLLAQSQATILAAVVTTYASAQALALVYIPVYQRPVLDITTNNWVRVVI